MSDVDWGLYADGACESLNRARTLDHAALIAADGMAYALDTAYSSFLKEYSARFEAADRIAAAYRATITRLTEDGPR